MGRKCGKHEIDNCLACFLYILGTPKNTHRFNSLAQLPMGDHRFGVLAQLLLAIQT